MKRRGKILLTAVVFLIGARFSLAEDVLVYHFDEGSGSVALDSSGNGNDGSIVGAAYVAGVSGTALHFEAGAGMDRVEVPSSVFSSLANSFYVEAWVRPHAYSPSSAFNCQTEIIRKRAPFNDWSIQVYNDGRFGCTVFTVGGGVTTNGGLVPLDQWTQVACAYDGQNVTSWVDGTEVDSRPESGVIDWFGGYVTTEVGNNTTDFGINCLDYGFRGDIDELIISDVQPPEDSDGDGVPDVDDICPGGDDNLDTDEDAVPDFCDPCPLDDQNDADGDGLCGDVDICEGGDDNLDADEDGTPDFCDVCPLDPNNDADGDGVCSDIDNCPSEWNPNQTDTDEDGAGDTCDDDDDGDGVDDPDDNCQFDSNAGQEDFDEDGIGDVCDMDDDEDGVGDDSDECPYTPVGEPVSGDGCSIGQLCPCDGGWKNHGAYVRCVVQTTQVFVNLELIAEDDMGVIVSEAAQSACGHKNQ